MSVLPQEIHTALVNLLQGLQSTDNKIRQQAEEQLNTEWAQARPDVLLMGLVEQLHGSPDIAVSPCRRYNPDWKTGADNLRVLDPFICSRLVPTYFYAQRQRCTWTNERAVFNATKTPERRDQSKAAGMPFYRERCDSAKQGRRRHRRDRKTIRRRRCTGAGWVERKLDRTAGCAFPGQSVE